MKRTNAWAGLVLFGVWLVSSAIAGPGPAANVRVGPAFRSIALVRDATLSRQTAGLGRTALVRDATRFGPWRDIRPHRNAYRSRYDYRGYHDGSDGGLGGPGYYNGYPDGPGYYNYGAPYGYGYPDNYLYYPGNYDFYPYPPEEGGQAADTLPPVTTGVGLVTAVQTKLTRQAYYDGPTDGVINAETRRAIREYQQDHGLPVTGLINPDLLSSMAIRYISPLS